MEKVKEHTNKEDIMNFHKSKKSHNTLIQTLLMFTGLHVAFQFGGLYNVFFAA